MKLLKIENSKGYFYLEKSNNYDEIDKIDKESLLFLVKYIINNEDFEMDEYMPNIIVNKAQDIVYNNIYIKLIELSKSKKTIKNSINSKYKEALEKYK